MFCGSTKGFDKEPRKVLEWAMRKKGSIVPEVLARSVMSLYEEGKTSIGCQLLVEFVVKVGMH